MVLRWPAIVMAVLSMTACEFPRDAAGTLARVRGGVLRVGVVNNPPFVIDTPSGVRGVEGALAGTLAQQLGARIEWRRGPEHALMRALRKRSPVDSWSDG